ncbi:hypothetical protein HDV06_000698 [Boothiomyces sp. JEL0866]|nr:hypothetical protein HDV06_000698 [Boothiomyces sp. JEL0866]
MERRSGPWTDADNASWLASVIFGAIFLTNLIVETFLRFKKNSYMWYFVAIACVVNIVKIAILVDYLQIGWLNNNWAAADPIYKAYSILQFFIYFASDIAFYIRKHSVVKEKYYLDEVVLAVCFCLDVASVVPSFLTNAPANIWDIASNCISAEIWINFLYFDCYYLFRVIQVLLRGNKFTRAELTILLPLVWTSSTALMYISGTEMYSANQANFYSNAYWNLASVIYPIVAVQSCVSAEISNYYQKQSQSNSKATKFSTNGNPKSAIGKKEAD